MNSKNNAYGLWFVDTQAVHYVEEHSLTTWKEQPNAKGGFPLFAGRAAEEICRGDFPPHTEVVWVTRRALVDHGFNDFIRELRCAWIVQVEEASGDGFSADNLFFPTAVSLGERIGFRITYTPYEDDRDLWMEVAVDGAPLDERGAIEVDAEEGTFIEQFITWVRRGGLLPPPSSFRFSEPLKLVWQGTRCRAAYRDGDESYVHGLGDDPEWGFLPRYFLASEAAILAQRVRRGRPAMK